MSVWSAIRRSPATLALLGGAGQFMGEMNKSREALEAEKRASRTRLGEMTLRQMLDEQSQGAAERRQQASPLYKAQIGQARAGQRVSELGAAKTQQELDYLNSLSPEARQAFEAGKRTPEELQAEIDQKQAYTKYLSEGGAGAAKQQLQISKEEQQRQLEQAWWDQTAADRAAGLTDAQKDYAVYNLGGEYRLDDKLAVRWRVWLNDYRKRESNRAALEKVKAGKVDITDLLGVTPATVEVPGGTGRLGEPPALAATDTTFGSALQLLISKGYGQDEAIRMLQQGGFGQ